GEPARLLDRARIAGLSGQRLRGAQTALAENALGGLGDGDQDPADPAALLANWTVGEDEIALFDEAVPVERQEEIDHRRRGALEPTAKHRSDDLPDLGEGVAGAAAHRRRMLGRAEDGSVTVVVELGELR